MIFADYSKRVLEYYRKQKDAGLLRHEIAEPTPGRLRDMSLIVYNDRYERGDEGILERFFGKTDENKNRHQTIERVDLDRLRPLVNYLKTSTVDTELKNIDLLAWLIDYKGRPYRYGPDEYDEPDGGPADEAPSNKKGPINIDTQVTVTTVRQARPKRRKLVIVLTVTIVLAGIVLVKVLNSPGCMYWAGDHYQPVPCSEASDNVLTLPIDSRKVARFRKITRPDTITENALGSIWCVRYHNVYECYTDSGHHPIDTTLKLQLLTDYILIRYIHPGLQPTATLSH